MKITMLIILSFFCFYLTITAQDITKSANLKSGLEFGGALCYSGININLAYTLNWKEDNTIFVGPKIAVSDSYLPSKGPWGIHLGYRRLLPGQSKFRAFATFDYQLVFLKPYNPNNLDINGNNEIHEIILSYGIQYRIWKNLIIGNSMGGGLYFERFFDSVIGTKNSYAGFDAQLRLFAQYSF